MVGIIVAAGLAIRKLSICVYRDLKHEGGFSAPRTKEIEVDACRNMSTPVWEEEQLGSYSRRYPETMPLPNPDGPADHSAMYLDVDPDGDTLIGRAANGEATAHQSTALSRTSMASFIRILPSTCCWSRPADHFSAGNK